MEDQIIDYLPEEELGTLSDMQLNFQTDMQRLIAAEEGDGGGREERRRSTPAKAAAVIARQSSASETSPAIKTPTGGEMIYLQKLKKVKKPKIKKEQTTTVKVAVPEGNKRQRSVRDYFAKKE